MPLGPDDPRATGRLLTRAMLDPELAAHLLTRKTANTAWNKELGKLPRRVEAGVDGRRRTPYGRVRTCAMVPEALDPMRSWLDEQRAIWNARLDRLDAFVTTMMKERPE